MSKSIRLCFLAICLAVIFSVLGCTKTSERQTPSEVSTTATVTAVSATATETQGVSSRMSQPRSKDSSAAPSPRRAQKLIRHSGRVDGPIEYIVVEPPDAEPNTPIVVALHGWGDSPERFARLAEELDLRVRTIVARGRQSGPRRGRAWFPRGEVTNEALQRAVDDLSILLKQLKARYPKAPAPLVYGFSQGGMLALELLGSKPSCCSGIAALSARIVRTPETPLVSGKMPVLLTAGAQDTIVSIAETVQAQKRLEKAGHTVELITFDGRHSVPSKVSAGLRRYIQSRLGLEPKKEPAQR